MKVGDEVQLKSGGPIMTIERVDENDVYCVWFDDKNQLKKGVFLIQTLNPYKEVPPLMM